MGRGPGRIEGELLRLVGAGLPDFGAAVADVHAKQRTQAVEIALAVGIPDITALATLNHRDDVVGVIGPQPRKGHPEMPPGIGLLLAVGMGVLRGEHV